MIASLALQSLIAPRQSLTHLTLSDWLLEFLAAAILGLVMSARGADKSCDRTCLEEFVNQYLGALAAHDPSKLPLASKARYTENGQKLKLGDGRARRS